MIRKGYSLLSVIIIVIVTAIVSGTTVGVILCTGISNDNGTDYALLMEDSNVKEFLDVYGELTSDYYESVDKEELMSNAISGMISYLDESYSNYLDNSDANNLSDKLNGKYENIGITVSSGIVVNVVSDYPADNVGIKVQDNLISINDTNVEGKSTDEINEIIANISGDITIVLKRNDEEETYVITENDMINSNIVYKILENNTNIGFIKINLFSKDVSTNFRTALEDLESQNIDSLVIDLRGNTGGYLDEAYEIAQLFIKKGKVIYSIEDKDSTTEYKDKTNKSSDLKIVVLVNGTTASSSEVLASALKESYGATLVGTKTYGKGKVQHTYGLESGSLVKWTSSKWLTPSGECIDGVGITPDYVVDGSYNKNNYAADKMLSKAIELLSN